MPKPMAPSRLLKNFPARLEEIARDQGLQPSDIEIWFEDEARIGQKNKITRRWARRGSRPSAPHDQRTAPTYIFGAICPYEGKAAGLILLRCNTAAMNLLMPENSAKVAPGRHAVLLMDQAGWHLSAKLRVPPNITVLPLPPKCPELNPAENVWEFMRDNWALKPRLHLLRQHRRPLLRCLGQTYRSTLAHYEPRFENLGSRVSVIETWYNETCVRVA